MLRVRASSKTVHTPTAPRMTPISPTRIDAGNPGESFGAAPLKGTYVEPEEELPPEELKAEPVSPPVRLAPFGCETIIQFNYVGG
jgi:hypothetical protein